MKTRLALKKKIASLHKWVVQSTPQSRFRYLKVLSFRLRVDDVPGVVPVGEPVHVWGQPGIDESEPGGYVRGLGRRLGALEHRLVVHRRGWQGSQRLSLHVVVGVQLRVVLELVVLLHAWGRQVLGRLGERGHTWKFTRALVVGCGGHAILRTVWWSCLYYRVFNLAT